MPSRVATSSPAPPSASRAEQVAGGVGGADPLGHHAERRAGVELLDDPERRGAGDLVAGPDRVLHRGGAAPRGQAGEVQVDPAVRRDVERRLRQQRAVGDDRAAVGRQVAQLLPGTPGRGGGSGLSTGTPSSSARWADRAGDQLAAAARRRVGAGDDADQLVARSRRSRPGRARRPRGCRRRRQAHLRGRARAVGVRADLDRRAAPAPNHSDSRISFIAALRAALSSRSMNSTPSRWSVSCWMRAGQQLGALDRHRARRACRSRGPRPTGPGWQS